MVSAADILIDFDNAKTSFPISSSQGIYLNQDKDYLAITRNNIYFNSDFDGFFNDELAEISASAGVPEPINTLGAKIALGFGAFFKRRLAKKQE
ncbi:MAG: PEP-CTERM sorting domain-containing protein [Moorea sp. SIO2B7]|nr:PEP-CTERM sorting domain-containing protein [Moorena sp. SIO2B7]